MLDPCRLGGLFGRFGDSLAGPLSSSKLKVSWFEFGASPCCDVQQACCSIDVQISGKQLPEGCAVCAATVFFKIVVSRLPWSMQITSPAWQLCFLCMTSLLNSMLLPAIPIHARVASLPGASFREAIAVGSSFCSYKHVRQCHNAGALGLAPTSDHCQEAVYLEPQLECRESWPPSRRRMRWSRKQP